jgi:hypothetical protein
MMGMIDQPSANTADQDNQPDQKDAKEPSVFPAINLPQSDGERFGSGVSTVCILCHCLEANSFELSRYSWIENLRRNWRLAGTYRQPQDGQIAGSRWHLAGQEFVKHDAKAVDVRAGIHPLTTNLFPCHICRRPRHPLHRPIFIGPERNPKVSNEGRAPVVQQNVRWLDVPVNDVALMCMMESVSNASDQPGGLYRAGAVPNDFLGQIPALNELRHDKA